MSVPPPPLAAVPPPPPPAVVPLPLASPTTAVPPSPVAVPSLPSEAAAAPLPAAPTASVPPPPAPPAVAAPLPAVSAAPVPAPGVAAAVPAPLVPSAPSLVTMPLPANPPVPIPAVTSVPPSSAAAVPPPPPPSVAAVGPVPPLGSAPLPTAAAAAPQPPQPQPQPFPCAVTDERWQQLEQEARQQVTNQEGTRYLEVEELVRDEVYRLFILSGYDVLTMLANVTRSLQHLGRLDVGLMRNEDSTAFTITQSIAYGGGATDERLTEVERRRRQVEEAVARVNEANRRSQVAFDGVLNEAVRANEAYARANAPARKTAPASATVEPVGPFRPTTYERLMASIDKQRRENSREATGAAEKGRRSASAATNRGDRHVYPQSSNGNHLLRRYGGSYVPENSYSYYRYHGLAKK